MTDKGIQQELDLRRNFEILGNPSGIPNKTVEKAWNDIFGTISKMLNSFPQWRELIRKDPDWINTEYDFCLKIYEKFSERLKRNSIDEYGAYLLTISKNELFNKDNKIKPTIKGFRKVFNELIKDLKINGIIYSVSIELDIVKSKIVFDKTKTVLPAVSFEEISHIALNSLSEISFNFKKEPFNDNYKEHLKILVIEVLKESQSPVWIGDLRVALIEALNLDPEIEIKDDETDADSDDFHSEKTEHEKWIGSGELDTGQIATLSAFAKDVYFKRFSIFLKQSGSKVDIWRYVLYHKIGEDWKGIHVVEAINLYFGSSVISSATLTQWLSGRLNLDDADKNINEAIMMVIGSNVQLASAAFNLSESIKIETARELGLKLPDTICAVIQNKINKNTGLKN
ncbi:MAG: hypothetical protein J0L62_11620 [Bacteroidetes bacterium]|nr:hypothetical protein [Bacteroidota bacterium]